MLSTKLVEQSLKAMVVDCWLSRSGMSVPGWVIGSLYSRVPRFWCALYVIVVIIVVVVVEGVVLVCLFRETISMFRLALPTAVVVVAAATAVVVLVAGTQIGWLCGYSPIGFFCVSLSLVALPQEKIGVSSSFSPKPNYVIVTLESTFVHTFSLGRAKQ